jgi:hypothetical protein
MNRFDIKNFAATLCLFFGELAIVALMYLDAAIFHPVAVGQDTVFWFDTAIAACGVAAVCGLIVDGIRFASTFSFEGKHAYRLEMRTELRRNLI